MKSHLLFCLLIGTLAFAQTTHAAQNAAVQAPAQAAAAKTETPKAWTFTQNSSTLEFIGQYDGEDVNGVFERFNGTVSLDANGLPSFRVEVEVASLNSDYADRDEVLKSSDWFNAVEFPRARYQSAGNCEFKAGSLRCPGNLTIRDKTAPVSLEVSLNKDGSLQGSAKMDRKVFGVGQGEWDEAGVIGSAVEIRFTLKK